MDHNELVQGNSVILVQYKGKIFQFKDHFNKNKFLRQPWKYHQAQLPKKMPAKLFPYEAKKLAEMNSYIGYLEQEVGQVILRGMADVGRFRLCFPHLDPKETALKHLAIFLKANNPKSSVY